MQHVMCDIYVPISGEAVQSNIVVLFAYAGVETMQQAITTYQDYKASTVGSYN